MKIMIEESWKEALQTEFQSTYFKSLISAVKKAYRESVVYPPNEDIFSAFTLCPLDTVKVVILGQDPYHGPEQAHGLSFSVQDGVKIPPSLKNIYKEIETDLGNDIPESGNLERWAMQGVLLLNSTLTVEKEKPGSHQKIGWEQFTDAVIQKISDEKERVVFVLWGAFAQSKAAFIDEKKHLVLKAPHPSPLSVYRGFFGCRHFSQVNNFLKKTDQTEIKW